CERVDLEKVNRRALETLIRCGALDDLGPNRATMMNSLTTAIQMADQHTKNAAAGMSDMFGFAAAVDVTEAQTEAQWAEMPEWDDKRRLTAEKESLGLYLSGHPIDMYRPELKKFTTSRIANLQSDKTLKVTVGGLLVGMRVIRTKRGSNIGILTIDDKSGKLDVTLFSEALETHRDILKIDSVIVASGEVTLDDFSGGLRMQGKEIYDMDGARDHFSRRMIIRLTDEQINNTTVQTMASTLQPYREGKCPVFVRYSTSKAQAGLRFGEEWRIKPTEDLLAELKTLVGEDSIALEY
ncbi:MAG: OB-fold nucleic acid binding domain-containing protein, partial [Gammaproteobacteria bacterium]|nr:OB-fold nucleic acid binding domain-containing protein [Gammaproteobacteria bacterium]